VHSKYFPTPQSKQVSMPMSGWNLPPEHGLHTDFPVAGWTFPATHSVQLGAAVELDVPVAHGVHTVALTAENVPASQSVHTLDGSLPRSTLPASQSVQTDDWADAYWPPAQAAQSHSPVVPPAQLVMRVES
jgi:hypothetical protein